MFLQVATSTPLYAIVVLEHRCTHLLYVLLAYLKEIQLEQRQTCRNCLTAALTWLQRQKYQSTTLSHLEIGPHWAHNHGKHQEKHFFSQGSRGNSHLLKVDQVNTR